MKALVGLLATCVVFFTFARSAGYPGYVYYSYYPSYYGYGWGVTIGLGGAIAIMAVAEALVGRRTRQAWPRMARASLTRSLGQDAFLFWNCASLGRSLFWNLAFSLILKRPRSHFCVSSGIRVCKAERPPVTTETGRSQIRQWHGQDTGLGLRNIAIIWGESAT